MVASKTARKTKGRKKKIYSGRSGAQSKYSDDLGYIRGPNLTSNVVRSGAKSQKDYIDTSSGRASFSRARLDKYARDNYAEGGRVDSGKGRGGPAKIKNKRREEMNEGIEAAVSAARTAPDKRSMRQKVEDRISDFGRKYQDKMSEFRLTGDIQKYKAGGDVRFNANRGKTY